MHRELAEMDDRELLGITGSLPRFSQRRIAACELLVGRYRGLVWSCVQRYRRGAESAEDLMQVGYVGLVAAINTFDSAVGCSLATYARSHINGEIRRHFRDKRWQLHVVRPVKELVMQARTATWQLAQELGRTPTESDLAASLGVSGHDLRDAQLAEMAFQPTSLDAPLVGQPDAAILADLLGEEDPQMDPVLCMQALATHWGELPSREQKILLMRFYGGMTQARSASGSASPRCRSPGCSATRSAISARVYSGLTSPQPPGKGRMRATGRSWRRSGGTSAWISGARGGRPSPPPRDLRWHGREARSGDENGMGGTVPSGDESGRGTVVTGSVSDAAGSGMVPSFRRWVRVSYRYGSPQGQRQAGTPRWGMRSVQALMLTRSRRCS